MNSNFKPIENWECTFFGAEIKTFRGGPVLLYKFSDGNLTIKDGAFFYTGMSAEAYEDAFDVYKDLYVGITGDTELLRKKFQGDYLDMLKYQILELEAFRSKQFYLKLVRKKHRDESLRIRISTYPKLIARKSEGKILSWGEEELSDSRYIFK